MVRVISANVSMLCPLVVACLRRSFKCRTISCDSMVLRKVVARILSQDVAPAQRLRRQVDERAPPEELLESATKPKRGETVIN